MGSENTDQQDAMAYAAASAKMAVDFAEGADSSFSAAVMGTSSYWNSCGSVYENITTSSLLRSFRKAKKKIDEATERRNAGNVAFKCDECDRPIFMLGGKMIVCNHIMQHLKAFHATDEANPRRWRLFDVEVYLYPDLTPEKEPPLWKIIYQHLKDAVRNEWRLINRGPVYDGPRGRRN